MEIFYNRLIYFLEKFLNHKYWYVITAAITSLIVIFLTSPSYFPITKGFHPPDGFVSFQEIIDRADHLLKPTKYPDGFHMANTQLRLTVPLIAKLIGSRSKVVIFIIQEVFGILFLIMACLLSYRLTKDKIISAVLTLSMGFIYVGKAAFVDVFGFTDSFAYFFLILALFTRNKPLLLVSLLLAYFTDERAILSSAFIAIFYFLEFLEINGKKISPGLFLKGRIVYVVLSWILYILIRVTLFKLYGLHTPPKSLVVPDVGQLGPIFWDGLQGFWLLIIFGVVYLMVEKRFFILLLLIGSILVIFGATSVVYDLTRSTSYVFPIIFVSLYLIEKLMGKLQVRKIIILICLICFLCPDSFYILHAVVNPGPRYYESVPMKVIEKALSHRQYLNFIFIR